MTPFRAAAAFAILLAGAGSAQAGTTFATVGGVNVDPNGFGGFETPYNSKAAWGANGGVTAPTTVGLVTTGGFNSSNALRVSDHSNSNPPAGPDTAQQWTYVGLTNVTVAAGSLVTVSAEVAPALAGDIFGIVFGTTITSNTPAAGFFRGLANSVASVTATHSGTKWNAETFTFTAPSSTFDINFGFYDSTAITNPVGSSADYAYLDAVSITYPTPAPEPVSLALLGTGLLGLGLARRRKRA